MDVLYFVWMLNFKNSFLYLVIFGGRYEMYGVRLRVGFIVSIVDGDEKLFLF